MDLYLGGGVLIKKLSILVLCLICLLTGCTIEISIPDIKLPSNDNTSTPNDNETNEKPNEDSSENDNTSNDDIKEPIVEKISYFGSDNDVYRINIETDNGNLPTSTSTYLNATFNITEQDITKVLNDTSNIQIRVRGNSTSAPDKKPYKLKFKEGTSLFGLKKAKDWVLLANYFDKSNVRNYLAYTLANKIDNLNFQPSSIFIDLYINSKYQGLYMLCEQIEANNGRVDIENHYNSDGVSSFLLEVDDRAKDEFNGYKNKCYFTLGEYDIAFKYPSANDYISAFNTNDNVFLEQYIKDSKWAISFFTDALAILKSNNFDEFSKYFDIESFINYYFIQEFFKNVDVSSTSQFYVIDQADETVKIKCGPVWDFDISAGVVDDSQNSVYTTYAKTELYVKQVDMFYRLMFNNRKFNQKVSEKYNEIRPLILETFDELTNIKNALTKAQNRNQIRWKFPIERKYWIEVNAMSIEYFNLENIEGHYDYLESFLNERLLI